ncbi:MAG: MgtC/SapB family protein [Lachnospiraceae bacterium]|nr:MgtC/SapB family protein [Lachnospiraceae bacterium]
MVRTEAVWVLRIIFAGIMGGFIGYERHSHSKEAGIRTHAIVAIGAALFMVLSKYGFDDSVKVDEARIAAQVVSGVGFLGAGIIFLRNNVIQGMSTAAGIWTTSAIGLAYGAGLYFTATSIGLLVIGIQIFFQKHLPADHNQTNMKLSLIVKKGGTLKEITDFLRDEGYVSLKSRALSGPDKEHWVLEMNIYTVNDICPIDVIDKIQTLDIVKSASIE